MARSYCERPSPNCPEERKRACRNLKTLVKRLEQGKPAGKAKDTVRESMKRLDRCRKKSGEKIYLLGLSGQKPSKHRPKPYPKGRHDARISFGALQGKKSAICVTPQECPPGSEMPDYHQVITVRKKPRSKERFTCSRDVFDYFRGLQYAPAEQVYAIGLTNRNSPVVVHKVSSGGLTETQVDPRVLFAPLFVSGAARFMLIHQHPSGDPNPSPDDVALTRRVSEVGALMGIPLLDHLVIAGDDVHPMYTSFRDAGLMS